MTATPEIALAIARAIGALGGRALLVGGCVRDELLGRAPKDFDLEVFGVPADRLRAILDGFGRVDTVGESFTVYKIGGLDVALPRRESKTGRGHKGFVVHGDPGMSFEDAARRRDFTINAISRDPLTGALIDPFHGQRDLAAHRLHIVDPERFGDDSLRVLRALQFAARFDLTATDETKAICRSTPLDDLPSERIWGEIEKLLLLAERPSIGLALARELDVVRRLFPELETIIGCRQDPEWHPEGDVWVHTLMVVDQAHARIAGLARGPAAAMMLGALCHDLGKPATTVFEGGHVRSPGHEVAGVAPATALLDRLNVHTLDGYDVRGQVLGLVTEHMRPGAFRKSKTVSDGAFRRLSQRVDLELLAGFAEADCRGRTGDFDCSAMTWFLERARTLGVEHGPPPPVVLGRHLLELGVPPGPAMGVLLKQLYERQLDGVFADIDAGMEAARALVSKSSHHEGHEGHEERLGKTKSTIEE